MIQTSGFQRIFILALPGLFLLICSVSKAQWKPTGGPYGGKIVCMETLNDAVFAGTDDGIYVSADQGGSWIACNSGLSNKAIISIATSGKRLYLLTGDRHIYFTENSGYSWTALDSVIDSKMVNVIAVDKNKIYAGTGDGIFISSDNGKSWIKAGSDITELRNVVKLTVSGSDIYAGTYGNGIFMSPDTGKTWKQVNSGFKSENIYVDAVEVIGLKVFCCIGYGRIYVSNDKGANWTEKDDGLIYNCIVNSFRSDGTFIYAGCNDGIYRITTKSEKWTKMESGINDNKVRSLTLCEKKIFAGTENSGVFMSDNKGENWVLSSKGIGKTDVIALEQCGKNIFAATFGNGLFVSSDNGGNWTEVITGLNDKRIEYLSAEDSLITVSNVYGEVCLSFDYGMSWKKIDKYQKVSDVKDLLLYKGVVYLAGQGIYKYLPETEAWAHLTNGLPYRHMVFEESDGFHSEYDQFLDINVLAGDSMKIFACPSNDGIYTSADSGRIWSSSSNSIISSASIWSLAICGSEIYASSEYEVFYSPDNGISWNDISGNLPHFVKIRFLSASGNSVYAATEKGIYAYHRNSGWTDISSGQVVSKINSLLLNKDNVFIGTKGNGVWKCASSDLEE